jgi:hypothetical protein
MIAKCDTICLSMMGPCMVQYDSEFGGTNLQFEGCYLPFHEPSKSIRIDKGKFSTKTSQTMQVSIFVTHCARDR